MQSQSGKTDFAGAKNSALRLVSHLAGGKIAKHVLSFVSGLALAFASMGSGIAPFALSFVAMCREEAIFAALGAFCGYVLAFGAGGFTYAAAVLVCYTCHIVFKDTKAGKTPYLMPVCAFLSLFCVKIPVALASGLLGAVMLLCESVLCAGFCLLFETAAGRQKSALRTGALWGWVAVVMAALLIFQPLRIFGSIAPVRVVAVLAVMTIGCCGGSALGAGAGAAIGACMDIAGGTMPFFATAYGFSGLLGGVGGQRGRFTSAVCYVLANCIATMWSFGHAGAVPGLFECFIASVLFVMMPDSLFERIASPVYGVDEAARRPAGQRVYAASRLHLISGAIGELGAAMEGFRAMLRPENGDITKVYDRAAEKVCRRCPTASVCWDKDYVTTHNALNDVTPVLKRQNALAESDFPTHFVGRCVHLRRLVGTINEEYRAHLRRLAASRREDEAHSLMCRQYAGLKGVLSDAADWAGELPEYYPTLEARVRSIAKAYCRPQRVSVYSRAGRMHVEIYLTGAEGLSDADAFMQSLSLALRRSFWPPEAITAPKGCILKISQRERLRASVSCAVRKKQGEPVCGDTSAHLHTEDGRAVILLSDGMGTGGAANAASSKAVELISGFVMSGCGLAESTRAVMPVLAARFEAMGFVTLDLLEINLFTGQAQLIKLGAAPSFVIRGSEIEKIGVQTLPAGLAPPGDLPEPEVFRLEPGDRLVMLSDGVWENADTESTLAARPDADADVLSQGLIRSAVESGAVDDMSVIIIGVSHGNEEHNSNLTV